MLRKGKPGKTEANQADWVSRALICSAVPVRTRRIHDPRLIRLIAVGVRGLCQTLARSRGSADC
jgi:hypothetical protein